MNNTNQNKTFFTKTTKAGSYSIIITAVLLAVLIVINLIVSALPSRYTALDTSVTDMYTISHTTEKFISSLNEDITVYYIASGGETVTDIETFIERYAGLSSRIKIKVVDPLKDPTFLSKYTSTAPSDQSLIVESARRFKLIDYTELYYYYSQNYGRIDYTDTYTQQMLSYYGESYSLYFDAENRISSAIDYCIADTIPKAYMLTGHGEATMSSTLINAVGALNIETETLSLLDTGKIPLDASCIVILNPLSDISASEADIILDYLKKGGHMFLSTGYDDAGMTNLMRVMNYYGATAIPGMVYESNASNLISESTPSRILATVNTSHEITADLAAGGYKALLSSAHAIKTLDTKRESVKIESLFSTSDGAYIMNEGEGDTSLKAKYELGIAISESLGTDTTKLVWFGSSEMLTDSYAAAVSYGSYYYYLYALNWIFDSYESDLDTIAGKSLETPVLVVTANQAKLWSVIFIAVIPLAILTPGIICWVRRRRR